MREQRADSFFFSLSLHFCLTRFDYAVISCFAGACDVVHVYDPAIMATRLTSRLEDNFLTRRYSFVLKTRSPTCGFVGDRDVDGGMARMVLRRFSNSAD